MHEKIKATVTIDDTYEIISLSGEEKLSYPYYFIFDINTHHDLFNLINNNAHITIYDTQSNTIRHIHGIISAIDMTANYTLTSLYRVTLASHMHKLFLRSGTRIFSDMTIIECVKKILSEHNIVPEMQKWHLTNIYEKMNFIQQLENETDLGFINRLFKTYGITWSQIACDKKHLQHDNIYFSDAWHFFAPLCYTDPIAIIQSGENNSFKDPTFRGVYNIEQQFNATFNNIQVNYQKAESTYLPQKIATAYNVSFLHKNLQNTLWHTSIYGESAEAKLILAAIKKYATFNCHSFQAHSNLINLTAATKFIINENCYIINTVQHKFINMNYTNCIKYMHLSDIMPLELDDKYYNDITFGIIIENLNNSYYKIKLFKDLTANQSYIAKLKQVIPELNFPLDKNTIILVSFIEGPNAPCIIAVLPNNISNNIHSKKYNIIKTNSGNTLTMQDFGNNIFSLNTGNKNHSMEIGESYNFNCSKGDVTFIANNLKLNTKQNKLLTSKSLTESITKLKHVKIAGAMHYNSKDIAINVNNNFNQKSKNNHISSLQINFIGENNATIQSANKNAIMIKNKLIIKAKNIIIKCQGRESLIIQSDNTKIHLKNNQEISIVTKRLNLDASTIEFNGSLQFDNQPIQHQNSDNAALSSIQNPIVNSNSQTCKLQNSTKQSIYPVDEFSILLELSSQDYVSIQDLTEKE